MTLETDPSLVSRKPCRLLAWFWPCETVQRTPLQNSRENKFVLFQAAKSVVLCYSSSRILILRGLGREVMSKFVLLTDDCCAVWKMDLGECKFGGRETSLGI